MPIDRKIITLKEACEIIGISVWHGYRVYHRWPDYGTRILKYKPNARPRFYASDIYRMMERKK